MYIIGLTKCHLIPMTYLFSISHELRVIYIYSHLLMGTTSSPGSLQHITKYHLIIIPMSMSRIVYYHMSIKLQLPLQMTMDGCYPTEEFPDSNR